MATRVNRNSVADIKISPAGGGTEVSYKSQMQFFSVRGIVPQVDASTFADEPNTKWEAGETIFIVSFNGLLMYGAGAWATFLPPPQGCTCTWQMHTSVTFAGTFNFDDTLAARPVNAGATIAGTARSTGAVVVTIATS